MDPRLDPVDRLNDRLPLKFRKIFMTENFAISSSRQGHSQIEKSKGIFSIIAFKILTFKVLTILVCQ